MSSTAINFPKDRSELDQSINTGDFSPGTPLQNDDTFITAGTSYQWRQDDGETYGRWRNEDPGATGDGRYVQLEDSGLTQVINGGGILSINDNVFLDGSDGSAEFAGTVLTSVSGKTGPGFLELRKEGNIQQRFDGSLDLTYAHALYSLGTDKDELNYLLRSTGNIEIGGDLDISRGLSNPNISLQATDGSATFAGVVDVGSTLKVINSSNQAEAKLAIIGNVNNTTNYGKYVFTPRKFWIGPDVNDANQAKIEFGVNDGNASFAGGNCEISSDGLLRVKRSAANGSGGLVVYPDNDFSADATAAINTDGSASFAGGAAVIASSGKVEVKRNDANTSTANSNPCFVVKNSATNADSVWLANDYIRMGGTLSTAPNISLNLDGSATFAGSITNSDGIFMGGGNTNGNRLHTSPGGSNSVALYIGNAQVQTTASYQIWLEPDNAANYTTTTDSEGNQTSIYNGPSIDVKRTLQAIAAALATLSGTSTSDYLLGPLTEAPTPSPEPEPTPDPTNLIPDDWTQDQRMAAMAELLQEYQANR